MKYCDQALYDEINTFLDAGAQKYKWTYDWATDDCDENDYVYVRTADKSICFYINIFKDDPELLFTWISDLSMGIGGDFNCIKNKLIELLQDYDVSHNLKEQ